jgi:hypothetical protein
VLVGYLWESDQPVGVDGDFSCCELKILAIACDLSGKHRHVCREEPRTWIIEESQVHSPERKLIVDNRVAHTSRAKIAHEMI